MSRQRVRAAYFLVILIAAGGVGNGQEADRAGTAQRFAAWLADGRRVSAPRLSSWHAPASIRELKGQEGDGGANRLRLIRDRQAKVALKAPYLLLANGDVLTGSPIQLAPNLGRQGITPRVQVQLEGMLPVSGTGVAVRTDRIARIVGTTEAPARQEPPPGTVQLADGRRLVGRSIKWRDYGLAVLTPEGIVEASYSDIVDAVFPDIDSMAAVLDDSLVAAGAASPAGSGSIVRFQLTSGATITAARIIRQQETQRRSRRGGVELTTYYYAQPAWADEPLALPERDVAWCGYRAASEVPLALMPVELAHSEQLIGGGRPWHRSTGGDDGLAATGAWEADLALCTHSHSELAVTLPPGAKKLWTTVGLDRAVGAGGCVRCRIVADRADGGTLWDSGVLLGSDEPKPTGPLDVTDLSRVVLVTEFAHQDRPPGADPLDLRDDVVWIAPLVELDLDQTDLLPDALAGAGQWELSGSGLDTAGLRSVWDAASASWIPVLALPEKSELALTRKLAVSRAGDVVEFLTTCPDEADAGGLELCVGGNRVPSQVSMTPEIQRQWLRYRDRSRLRDDDRSHLTDRFAYWWDLSPWRGEEVTLELVVRAAGDEAAIAWRGLSIRGAIGNLPAGGQPLTCDVPLSSLEPSAIAAGRSRGTPVKNGLPGERAADRSALPIRFLGQPHYGGYGMAANSSVSFELAPEYKRFVAVAGCSLFVAGPLAVLVDGKVAWERPLMTGLEPAEQIDIPIPAGAKTLTLQTGPESSYTGLAAFAEAGFVTK